MESPSISGIWDGNDIEDCGARSFFACLISWGLRVCAAVVVVVVVVVVVLVVVQHSL